MKDGVLDIVKRVLFEMYGSVYTRKMEASSEDIGGGLYHYSVRFFDRSELYPTYAFSIDLEDDIQFEKALIDYFNRIRFDECITYYFIKT